jgi:endonuclease/exonuclease/phosphatase family metal-dependent hydrolase
VAKCVRERLDQVTARNPESKIIVMGDFNDEPSNLSLARHLKAKRSKNIDGKELFNLANDPYEKGEGTCVHDGDWLMIDQIMINRNLLQNNNDGLEVRKNKMYIHAPEELIFHKKDYSQPDHTYSGDRYEGGVSDHLPVYIKLD